MLMTKYTDTAYLLLKLSIAYNRLYSAQAKLAAVENAHREDQIKVNQQIEKLQGENVSLRDEKGKLAKEMEGLENQLKQS